MIPRYSRPEMADIWRPETRYRIWFEIEAHAAEAMAELGTIPKAVTQQVKPQYHKEDSSAGDKQKPGRRLQIRPRVVKHCSPLWCRRLGPQTQEVQTGYS